MLHIRDIGQEFRPMLRLAAPLALTELGWLAMSFTDTVMVGRLPDSATAIGAVSLGSTLFYTIGVFGSGVMLGMDIVKPVVVGLISANLVNRLGNWVLVYGHLGARGHGVAGSGWSTCISRAYMVAVLAVAVVYYDRKRTSGLWSASRRLELR